MNDTPVCTTCKGHMYVYEPFVDDNFGTINYRVVACPSCGATEGVGVGILLLVVLAIGIALLVAAAVSGSGLSQVAP